MLFWSVKKPESIFVPDLPISGPEDMECRGEQQTRAEGMGVSNHESGSHSTYGADMCPLVVYIFKKYSPGLVICCRYTPDACGSKLYESCAAAFIGVLQYLLSLPAKLSPTNAWICQNTVTLDKSDGVGKRNKTSNVSFSYVAKNTWGDFSFKYWIWKKATFCQLGKCI